MPTAPEVLALGGLPSLGGQGDEVGRRLSGYVAKYGVESHPIRNPAVHHRPFVEVILPGAFDRHLATRPNIPALCNHDKTLLLGRTRNGSLELRSDSIGLAFNLLLPRTTVGEDARELVERRDVEGCSLGMIVQEHEIIPRPGPTDLRRIVRAFLHEVTPVCTFPAYSQTEIALREQDLQALAPPSRPRFELRRRLFNLNR